jgi:hypothetical protein
MKSKDKRHRQITREPFLTLEGTIREGAVVLEDGISIPDGARVRIIVSENAVPPATFQSLLKFAKTQPPARKTPDGGTWGRRIFLGLLALLTAGGVVAFFEFVVPNLPFFFSSIPSELVGKWVVLEGPQEGATFDFFHNGEMEGRVNVGGKEGIINARIRVAGKNLISLTRHPRTGAEETRSQIIHTLTDKELVLEDEQGNLLKMERANRP